MRKKTKIVLKIEDLKTEMEALERVVMDTTTQIVTIESQISMLEDLRLKRKKEKIKPDDKIANIDDCIDIEEEKDNE